MNTQSGFKQKMPVDFTLDKNVVKIVVPIAIVSIVLYALCFKSPECEILLYLIWYIAIGLLLLKNRALVEITPHMIIIHRPLFDDIVVNKNDLTKIQVKKDTGYIFRWVVAILLFVLTGYNAYNAFNDTMYEIHGKTMIEGIILVLGEFQTTFLLVVLLLMFFTRLPYPALLRVDTGKSNIVFYSKENEELKRVIEEQDAA